MRIAVLIALCGVLATGCGQAVESRPGATQLTPVTRPHSSERPTSPAGRPPSTTSSAQPAPGAGASAAEAIAWVQAGPPADAAAFHVALRAGTTTPLGDDVAFTAASGTACMTDIKRAAAGLACLVNLTDPPPPPADIYGVWKGGWVDFDGAGVRIGSAHGDPGRFAAGQGLPLPAERSLSFGDFRCRADVDALICVNYARQSAVRYSDSGIEAYGCTRADPPAAGIGIQYSC